VAVFRIRVGRKIGSAALVADGYHARTATVGRASPSCSGPWWCGSTTRSPTPS
jgi:divalent metal cation (Fe/Co/Zn/Cd) transporter